jgi:uncharacterized paraquat-inducible protein A
MEFHRGSNGSDPIGRASEAQEEYRLARSTRLATGTLACPECDAPVHPGPGHLSPADRLGCPFCGHVARTRDFLSLAPPTRPARVAVRVVVPPSPRPARA